MPCSGFAGGNIGTLSMRARKFRLRKMPRYWVVREQYRRERAGNDSPFLWTIGRRVERLFVLGLVLMALSFFEIYLTTANFLISQDRAFLAVTGLLNGIQENRSQLEMLFNVKPDMAASAPTEIGGRAARVAAARKKLGLAPAKQKPSGSPPKKQPTYGEALGEVLGNVSGETGVSFSDMDQYIDNRLPPSELVKKLTSVKRSIESQPTSVWGIVTPRQMKIKYAGIDYQIPYDFLSTMLVAVMAPLIAGWLSLLYMARQREIFEITKATDFKEVFPHILNFVPVDFRRDGSAATPGQLAFSGGLLTALRVIVILVLSVPLVFAHSYSLSLLLAVKGHTPLWLIGLSVGFAVYVFFQGLTLVLQEGVYLKNKSFVIS
jgi:hypothetical protein